MTLSVPSFIKIYKLEQNVLRCTKIQAHTCGHGTFKSFSSIKKRIV